jgi:type IV pilus assembly protein PilV
MKTVGRYQSGLSMIEVLVTLVLISVGVLGMVALQSRTIQYTQDSVQRNVAATLANDLIELMRAMPNGLPASSGFYKAKGATFPDKPTSCNPLPNNASQQLACWAEKVKTALPGVTTADEAEDDLLKTEFYVCRTNQANTCTGTGDAIEIQIAWQVKNGECLDGDKDSTICRYRLRGQL